MALDPLTLAVVGTKIISGIFGKKARKAKRRARAATADIEKLRNLQAKRKFLRQFRQAQAATLVQGVASGAGLDSSAVQGATASQQTQAQFGSFEQEVQASKARTAGKQLDKASRFEFAGQLANLGGSILDSGIFPTGPADVATPDFKGVAKKNG